jgi:Phosphorylase superfamily
VAVDAQWMERNLGIAPDTLDQPAAITAGEEPADDRDLERELIEFDSEGGDGAAFAAIAPQTVALTQFVDLDWPAGLAPVRGNKPRGESLPKANVLLVTWTVDEGHALSRVLTPGRDSRDDWKPYTKNFDTISRHMRPGCPARNYGRLGTYWTTRIGEQKVTLFKSDSHMSQDGPDLPNETVWQQIIEDVRPEWVITTGTGGGIGPSFEVGDVIVSRFATFDCQRGFKRLDGDSYANQTDPPDGQFAEAETLFTANAQFLPADNTRPPQIISSESKTAGILTTDFFGFDNTDNTYGLQGKGDLSEMGDAVLGLVCNKLGNTAPKYTIVRNVSDPQINSKGLTLRQQTQIAANIYKGYGRWSTVCSAIVCWAIIADM